MAPRGFLGTWATIFAITALPFGLLMILVLGKEVMAESIIVGFLFGIFFGLIMAPFMMGVLRTLPCEKGDAFVRKLNVAMAEMGFNPKSQTGDLMVFEGVGSALKLGPLSLTPASFFTVSVQLEPTSATLVGPRWIMNRLTKRLLV